ncbi:MAG: endonuclease V [Euryarchaeota archaeon]|nr:endonuclease V [Euryarchaeota archaeon]
MPDCDTKIDLVDMIQQAVSMIPEGQVSTYGDIAKALGDVRAARAVGGVLSNLDDSVKIPTHRVVYSTGEVGQRNNLEFRNILRSEGVPFSDKRVRLNAARFVNFDIEPILIRLREEQKNIAGRVILDDDPGDPDNIAGLDVSYQEDDAFAAICIMDRRTGNFIEEKTHRCDVKFPYIPTYLTYRELPALAPLLEDIPDTIYMMDGHGVLHPRGAGIACQIGVMMGIPIIGAAKALLVGEVDNMEAEQSAIRMNGSIMGCMLRQGRKAAFVSPGNRTSLSRAVKLCSETLNKGIPAPLKRAHDLANKVRREAYS